MNAMTNVSVGGLSSLAAGMILSARDECGGRNAISVGAVALAEFIAANRMEAQVEGLILFLGGWTSVRRMLADDMMPGNEWGEEMGRVTDGAVTPNLWRRKAGIAIGSREFGPRSPMTGQRATTVIVDELPDAEPPARSAVLCEVAGLPGETVPGPLFAAIVDPLTPGRFVVTGFGQATVFDAARAQSFRAALADGLTQIGGDLAGRVA